MSENKYYVYALLDPRKPGQYHYDDMNISFNYEPFYIGKGYGNRIYEHFNESNLNKNSYKNNKIKKIINEYKDNPHILIIEDNLIESKSFELEKYFIKTIGRLDLGLGPLLNLTDGGEGTSGLKRHHKDETKTKISSTLKIYYENLSDEEKEERKKV